MVAALGIVGLLATACSAGPGSSRTPDGSFAAAGGWAHEFAESSEGASEFEAAILRDGVITPAELEEAQDRKRACMLDAGIRWKVFDDGTSEAESADGHPLGTTDEVHSTLARCSHEFDDSVTYLFTEVRRNPEKQDEAKITVACLRSSGLVGADYSERTWRSEHDAGTFSFDEWGARAEQCRLDPLGLWRKP